MIYLMLMEYVIKNCTYVCFKPQIIFPLPDQEALSHPMLSVTVLQAMPGSHDPSF